MNKKFSIEFENVLNYFNQLSAIPRGSGNMQAISSFCVEFAKKNKLKYIRDNANNVIIFKDATVGYENADPIILQGHLDIVCQKDADREIDFLKEGLEIYIEGDFMKARGTTLGADNGIAVAYILSILERKDIAHPAIEAVFTTDEEIGMLGALQVDTSVLKGKKLFNLDSEEDDTLTVSCAGGSDFKIEIPISRKNIDGTEIDIAIKGLRGGHSGVEINSGRVNANILAGRFLNYMNSNIFFDIISIDGGDKSNAIPLNCNIKIVTNKPDRFISLAQEYFEVIKKEISAREPFFMPDIEKKQTAKYQVLDSEYMQKIIYLLVCAPNGVVEMSAEIKGLVETSLNLGILSTEKEQVNICFSLRSNKMSAMKYLEDRLKTFVSCIPCVVKTSGQYPPWEFKENSKLQELYVKCYAEKFGFEPKVEALHAGLECGVFAAAIDGIDCIAFGPSMYDVHTTSERISLSSAQNIYELLITLLEKSL